jgi:hypothetical protein
MSVLVCHDEIVVVCDAEQADDTRMWLERAMIDGMADMLNGLGEVQVPITVESWIVNSWAL